MSADTGSFIIEEATIKEIHDAMSRGEITCRQLTEAYLRRIEAYDKQGPMLNAIICVNPQALEQADVLDAAFRESGFTGRLHGIPVLLKDNVDTATMSTTGGAVSFKGFVPPDDAFITKRLLEAGALILAKVNLHEFAIWGETASSLLGQTLNPYDLTRTPGGSSGGTGAGIAANFATVGIGTDTINSIRSPASANSLVGLRPTLGLVSRNGIIPYSLTQDTAGPITRTVADAAILLDVIAGYDRTDRATAWSIGHIPPTYTAFLQERGLQNVRVGVLKSFFGTQAEHQEINAVINHCLEVMVDQGACLIPVQESIDANALVAEVSVHLYDFKHDLNAYLSALGDKAPVVSLEAIIQSGRFHSGIAANIQTAAVLQQDDDYRQRLIAQMKVREQVMAILADGQLDVLVYPHQKRLVVSVGQSQVERNGVLSSVTGFPAITIPGGFSQLTAQAPGGVPIGIELLGRPWSEPLLFQVAYAVEQATCIRRPPYSTPHLV